MALALAAADLMQRHAQRNRQTADGWARFSPHRDQVTDLVAAAGRGRRLGVLGAGNGNDLDLERLGELWDEIVLVDLDGAALARAAERASPRLRSKLSLRAPVDVSGGLSALARWQGGAMPDEAELAALPGLAAARASTDLGLTCDAVVSSCVLSQILVSCADALGARHPKLRVVGTSLVLAHLAFVLGLTRPAGTSIVVTDAVSSRWFPFDAGLVGVGVSLAMAAARSAGKLVPGTDPVFLAMLLEQDEVLAPLVESFRFVAPWVWNVDQGLSAITYATVLSRRR